ncbi:TPR repeat containing exported protein [Rhodovulum sp. P5]|uniref:tol-pal system protein YbgF n=1 Tax=Rhodovulum sp. P5 TaxID=1564506 RepID=UPI0009C353F8|nr:tol-pal system protein YbgF [Rhodovulum sp. P5]ARE39796.1 TPR repeat containing exported protein [Rhodovulum sp. P5]
MRISALVLAAVLAIGGDAGAMAQSREQTLADIRQELSVLFVEMQKLKRELSTTSGPTPPGGASILQRVDALEDELRRLTAETEELEHRLNRVVEDGTRRIGDLEFRLVELEGGDVSRLGATSTLGGGELPPAPAPQAPDSAGGAELAVGERIDFDAARQALEEGRNAEAAALFQTFNDTYPGSPMSAEANYLRGQALSAMGETSQAARAYLESFAGNPNSPHAPASLLQLGMGLRELGQTREACVTLGEVVNRFPAAPEAKTAATESGRTGCN